MDKTRRCEEPSRLSRRVHAFGDAMEGGTRGASRRGGEPARQAPFASHGLELFRTPTDSPPDSISPLPNFVVVVTQPCVSIVAMRASVPGSSRENNPDQEEDKLDDDARSLVLVASRQLSGFRFPT